MAIMIFDEHKYLSAPFGCADKPVEKYCWLICCERTKYCSG
jgi:hypothetical protein